MKHFVKAAIGLFVVAAMATSAAAVLPCTPIPPAEWTGHANMLNHGGHSGAVAFFENNTCSWEGMDQMNGSDGIVWDIEGKSGAATGTATYTQLSRLAVAVQGYSLDASCSKIAGSEFHISGSDADAPTEDLLTIPAGAKWMVVTGTVEGFGNSMDVSIKTSGVDCPKPPKKKKKKR